MKFYEIHCIEIICVLYQQSQTTTFTFSPKSKSYEVDRLEITHVHYQQGQTETFTFCKDQILASKNKCIASEFTKKYLDQENGKVNLGVLSATVALRLAVLTTYFARALS